MRQVAGIPFGSYVLVKRLARGGMAEVFLAHQRGPEGFDRRVTIKRILPHLAESGEFVRMFLDEARLAARLSHPNVVHIYELGKVDDDYFIAMEYVDGVHAGALIKLATTERLPPALVARIGADACAGLHYAHDLHDAGGAPLHVVHRDVSPPNLMISQDGVVKLVDFGIAKAASQLEQTRPGVVKGKWAYMSPEQTVGKPLDGRSDVFSLGIVLWELLAGQFAVSRDDPVEAMRRIRDGRITPIGELRPDVPRALAEAIDMALEVDPRQRASGAELGLALEAFIKSSPELGTSMELATWLRQRFGLGRRTGSQPAMPGARASSPPVPGPTRPATVAATVAATAATPRRAQAAATTLDTPQTAFLEELDDPDPPTEVVVTPAQFVPGSEPRLDPDAIDRMAPRPRSRSHRGRRIAIVAVTTIAAGLAGVFLLGRSGGGAATEGARDAAATAGAAGAAADAAPAETTAAGTDASVIAEAPPVDAAPTRAMLEIVTNPPGAEVRLGDDDEPVQSPAQFDGLAPGTHPVRVDLDGYEHLERMVSLAPGERRTLELPLVKIEEEVAPEKPPRVIRRPPRRRPPGKVTIRTTPYSAVYLGKRKLGVTPFANVKLPAGAHVLTFKNPNRKPHRRRVVVRSGKTTKLNFALP